MPYDIAPKVVLNEEYLDLRSQTNKSSSISDRKTTNTRSRSIRRRALQNTQSPRRVVDLNNEGLRYEKELINCGLKKLATSYNATAQICQRQNNTTFRKKNKLREKSGTDPKSRKIVTVPKEKTQLKSQSEFSLLARKSTVMVQCISPNSTPIIQNSKTSQIGNKIEPVVNKYTMTKPDEIDESRFAASGKSSRSHSKTRSRSNDCKKVSESRFSEKYSIHRLPWQRSWTLPTFTMKSSHGVNCDTFDNSDRQTYLYDDGTEVDSIYLEDKRTTLSGKSLQKQCMMVLFFCGSICGILLVSLLIWFIFGNNFLALFFKPRNIRDGSFKKSIKFLGGGLIYVITRVFESLGYVLALPTQKVYQSEPEYYRWPINPIQIAE